MSKLVRWLRRCLMCWDDSVLLVKPTDDSSCVFSAEVPDGMDAEALYREVVAFVEGKLD